MLLKSSDIDITAQSVVIEVEQTSTEMDPNTFATVHYVNTKLDEKVDKIEGHRLLTPEEAEKLSQIEEGGQKNVQSDWKETDETSDAFIKNKPTTAKEFGLTDVYSKEDIDDKLDGVQQSLSNKADKYTVLTKKETTAAIDKALVPLTKEINLLKVNKADATLVPRVSKVEYRLDTLDSDIDKKLALKADKETTYTKLEVNSLVNSVDDSLKARISKLDDLKADKTSVYTKEESDQVLASKISDVEDEIATKADKSTVYTKQEVDYKFSTIPDDLVSRIDSKADKETTYTKDEVNTLVEGASGPLKELIDSKADKSDIQDLDTKINKTEQRFIAELGNKASKSSVYIKSEIDEKFNQTNQTITDGLANVYTKNEVYTKEEVDTPINSLSASVSTLTTETSTIKEDLERKIDSDLVYQKEEVDLIADKKIEGVMVNGTLAPINNHISELTIRPDTITQSDDPNDRNKYKIQEIHLSDWLLAKINSYANRRQSDWNIKDPNRLDFIRNKPTKLSQFENDVDIKHNEDVKNLPEAENLVTTSLHLVGKNDFTVLDNPITITGADIYVQISCADKTKTLKEYLTNLGRSTILFYGGFTSDNNPIFIIQFDNDSKTIDYLVKVHNNDYALADYISLSDVVDNSVVVMYRNAEATESMLANNTQRFIGITSAYSPYETYISNFYEIETELDLSNSIDIMYIPENISINITINKSQDNIDIIRSRAEGIAKLFYSTHVLEGELYDMDSTDFEFRRKIGVLWERMGGTVYSDGNFRN